MSDAAKIFLIAMVMGFTLVICYAAMFRAKQEDDFKLKMACIELKMAGIENKVAVNECK